MKIVIVAPEVFPVPPVRGGAVETGIEEVSARLTGHEVVILGVADPELPYFERKGHRAYYRWAPGPLGRLLLSSWKLPFKQRTSLRYFRPYSRWAAGIVRMLQPDVIWVHSRMPFVPWLRAAAPRARIVFSVHNQSNLEGHRVWSERVVSACDRITGCSRFMTEQAARVSGAAAARATVLYNGVNAATFGAWWTRHADRDRLRREHGLTGPVVLFAGRLVEEKGAHLLLEAFRTVLAAHADATLLMVGSHTFSDERTTPYVDRLHRLAEACGGRVRFVGHVAREAIAHYFLISDVVVLPSTWQEPFGLVILEAMATGLPVVAFDQGGPSEIVRHETTGLLLPREQGASGLAHALKRLLGDPAARERMGRAARATVESGFTWEAVAERSLALCGERPGVLIAETGSGFGGTAKYLGDLVSLLDPERYAVQVVACREGPFIEQLRTRGIAVTLAPLWRFPWGQEPHETGRERAWASWPVVGTLAAYAWHAVNTAAQLCVMVPVITAWLAQRRIRLVHLNNEVLSHLPLLCAARLAGCRVVCHLHGWRPFTRTERLAIRLVDELICISDAGARFHEAQLDGRRVLAIPNGLRANGHLDGLPARRDAARRKLALAPEDVAIAIVGRLVPWKGHEVYLQALASVLPRHPNAVGLIVGHDPSDGAQHEAKLRRIAEDLGIAPRIRFVPWQEDVWSVYAAADLIVHASTDPEPFGLVILEAMAAARPVVATASGGVVDLVQDGETGLLVPPRDPAAMAAAIARLLEAPGYAEQLAAHAGTRARERFTMDRNAQQVMAVYDRLLQGGARGRHG